VIMRVSRALLAAGRENVDENERNLYLIRIFISLTGFEINRSDGARHVTPAFPDFLDSIPQFVWEDRR
jgi:hypothetical protein